MDLLVTVVGTAICEGGTSSFHVIVKTHVHHHCPKNTCGFRSWPHATRLMKH